MSSIPQPRDSACDSESEVLATLSEIARIASEDLELRPMLQRITDALARRYGWDVVELVGIDDDPPRFVCEAITSRYPTEIHPGYSRPIGEGVVGKVAETGIAMVLDDVDDYRDFVQTVSEARSEICVPVVHRGDVVALLNVESRTRAAFTRSLELLERISDQISGAIANARLFGEATRRTDHLQILTECSLVALEAGDLEERLHRTAGHLRERFDLELVGLFVSDQSSLLWKHRSIAQRPPFQPIHRDRWPTSAGILGRALRTDERQLAIDVSRDPDYVAMRSDVVAELAVPLHFQESMLGGILYGARDPSLFNAESLALFEAISMQVAGAIELAVANQRLAESQRALETANRQLAKVNHELQRQTLVDGLTGIANRRSFDERLNHEWRRAARFHEALALAIVDVDHFKLYNDALGHLQGDTCLRVLAQILGTTMRRSGEFVARYGGEEFVALMPRLQAQDAMQHAEFVRDHVEARNIPHPASPVSEWVTVSIGVASLVPPPHSDPSVLLDAADGALYEAKNDGRNCVVLADTSPDDSGEYELEEVARRH